MTDILSSLSRDELEEAARQLLALLSEGRAEERQIPTESAAALSESATESKTVVNYITETVKPDIQTLTEAFARASRRYDMGYKLY